MEQTLGKRIMQNRKRLGLTQEQLAESLGVTAQAVSKWENDQSCPDISMLPKLAQLFGTTVDALLGNDTAPVYEAEVVQPEESNDNKWEFHWDPDKRSKLGLAIAILLMGIQLCVSSILQRDLSFWSLLWPTVLLVFGAWGLYPKFSFFRFGCFLFGGYFLAEKWALLPFAVEDNMTLPIILLLLGLSLLPETFRKKKKPVFSMHRKGNPTYDYVSDDGSFHIDASFGSMTQVITASLLERGSIDTSFGNYTVDLTQVSSVAPGCQLTVDSSFGQTTLLVPHRFCIHQEASTSFGHIDFEGTPSDTPEATITLEADISFGKLIIKYV